MTEPRKITTQHPGRCSVCKDVILPGTTVLWLKGEGISHVEDCSVETAEVPAAANGSGPSEDTDATPDELRAYATWYLPHVPGTEPLSLKDWLRRERASFDMYRENAVTKMLANENAVEVAERISRVNGAATTRPTPAYKLGEKFRKGYADAVLTFTIVQHGSLFDGTPVYQGVSDYEGYEVTVIVTESYLDNQDGRDEL